MPVKQKHPCNYAGCGVATHNRYCDKHMEIYKQKQLEYFKKMSREFEENRESASSRGYDVRWRRIRKAYLAERPLCVRCQSKGLLVTATVVDHIVPHCGDKELFYDSNNYQPLCQKCHAEKSLEDLKKRRRGEPSA
jgi:5-methylcytosine-specific restriction protein A